MMDSARDFDLLGESVPQVRVSARTLALLGFFSTLIYSDSLFRKKNIRVIPSDARLSLGGRPWAIVPKGSGKGQNRALVCGGQREWEGRSRMVKMSLVLVGFGPGPGSSVGRAPAASAGVPVSIPGWDVSAFFPSC